MKLRDSFDSLRIRGVKKRERERDTRGPRVRYFFIFSILLALYIAVLVSVGFPYAAENFRRFGMKEHRALFEREKRGIFSSPLSVVFYTPSSPVFVSKSIRMRGEDHLHLLLETLLQGPGSNDLKMGYISYIPEETRLIGADSINGIAFVELSPELLKSPKLEYALKQIEDTLLNTDSYYEVHVLVEGKEIYNSKEEA